MRETQEKVIGEFKYRVTQLPAGIGLRLITRVVKIIAPPIAEVLKGHETANKKIDLMNVEIAHITDAINVLVDVATEDDIAHIVEVLSKGTEVQLENAPFVPLAPILDEHFGGAYMRMFQWVAFSMEANYSDFFAGMGGLKAAVSAVQGQEE